LIYNYLKINKVVPAGIEPTSNFRRIYYWIYF